MLGKHILIAFIVQICISGIDNKEDFNGFRSTLSKYSIVKPQLINNRWTRSINKTSQTSQTHGEKISYTLKINNREHFLHLEKNRGFLHPNFVQYSRDANGNYNTSYPRQHVHCYYHGSVEGYPNSVVALSTCSGLRGVILLENETFGLEPVPGSTTNEHVLYRLKDSHSEQVTCGVIGEATPTPSYEAFEPGQSMTSLLRRKRNLPQTSYIELVLVVDNLRYIYKKKNDTAVREEMVQMANLLDGYYKPLNIRVVLVGLEVFKDSNPFSVEGSAGEVLGRFVQWRKNTLLPKIRHDIGQLIVGRGNSYSGGVLGMAFVGTVCSVASSGGINVFSEDKLNFVSTVVAHEMGHNLGMNHDSSGCNCDGGSCIMSGGASGSVKFSECSARDFESLIFRGGGVCLRNQPSPSDVIGVAECGNGRLDMGEECDCGPPEECKNKCCDAATCKLTSGSYCADGDCCDNCQIKVAGTRCRKSADACDLPEYCDGKTGFCPEDFYIMDGLPCQNNAAYCYEGRCQTYNYQCSYLFGSGARQAADICFEYENTKGNVFGNCGITSNGNYIKCTVENAKCGKVQCTNVDLNNHPDGAQISIQIVEGSTCVNADFNLGTDVLDPAYVNPGSPCDKGKTCIDFKCVNASVLLPNLDCDAKTTCNGQGVCNDQGHCHCNNGWAPPNCDKSGRGGSIDSGPAMIDYSLRNGLLIFFLLIVPLLIAAILVLLYVFKRDSLDICLKRNPKSRNTGNRNANAPTNGNVQTNVTIQPPGQVPPPRPPAPSGTSAPASGYRYGELDYWNQDTNRAPARPSPPVQGPGMPRPIPT
ncbi:disintegrin and metalloproteinase domain-containing protein 9 isoform X1 [Fundulus heteroclitus]|uniref:disintegrin and metalloproteinase domain-containing protein 9 isoform X1 n=1 Tax=Fundulus heteroclitus TaxID=8078 RepID=UPI00165BCBBD|nr:disintegrin and metalloproteinase domain-containing protein 9 isoform X1 [Fundulus heteroclitus]